MAGLRAGEDQQPLLMEDLVSRAEEDLACACDAVVVGRLAEVAVVAMAVGPASCAVDAVRPLSPEYCVSDEGVWRFCAG